MNPEARIKAYLETNRRTVQLASDVSEVVADVKLYVFHDTNPIPDDQIRKIVVEWATFNAIGLLHKLSPSPAPAAPASKSTPPSSSELIDTVKKVIRTINDGVTFGPEEDNLALTVTGATVNLKSGDKSVSAGISWSGALKLEAASGPLHFSGKLSKDQWELTLTFPKDSAVPDLSSVATVFSRGETAVRNLAAAAWNLPDVSDAGKIGSLVKPHIAAVQDAVEAASGIAAAPKSGLSFGFKVGSPQPGPGDQGIPGGVEGSLVFTYVF